MITRSLPAAYDLIRVRLVETLQTLTRKTSRATIPALLLLCSVPAAFAINWTNTSYGNWFIDTNWDNGVPTAANLALIDNGGTAFITGAFANADDLYVGAFFDSGTPGGNGTLLLNASSGNPGSLTTTDLYVGYLRFDTAPSTVTGNVNIAGGSAVHTKGTTYYGWGVDIGDSSSEAGAGPAAGTVTVDGAGSLLDAQVGSIVMGVGNATGTLVVQNGARAQSVGGSVGNGSATVKGAGSVWHSAGYLYVTGASGLLDIQSSGLVDTSVVKLFNGIVRVENGSLTVPGLTISGVRQEAAGNVAGSLIVGDTKTGRMELRSGGAVIGYRGFIGNNSGGVGSVLITDPSSRWRTTGSLWVGNSGNGTLDILNGATAMTEGNGYLAFATNTSGLATVDGAKSAWKITVNLLIGGNGAAAGGAGQLVIRNGGTVSAAAITLWDSGNLTLGINSTLTGPLTAMGGAMDMAAAITFPNNFTLGSGGLIVRTYGFNSTFSGAITGSGGLNKAGTFTGSGLGTLTLTGNSNYTGPTTVSFGKLVVDGSITSAVTVNSGALLAGTGTVGGVTINGGLAPGHSPGIFTVNGNYVQNSGGVLNVEIGGPTPGSGFDQVNVSGSATVDGTLNLSLVNGYRPVVGQQFAILTSSSETGNFATIKSSGFTVRSDASNAGIVLTVTSVVPGAPVITSATGVSGTQGQPFSYQITATESPTSFGATALPPGLVVDTTTGIISGTPTTIGSFDVTISATNSTGTGSATLTITVSAPPPPTPTPSPIPGQLANISTRLRVETGDNALIGGFIITGTQDKKVIIRAIGPSLSLSGKLEDPTLELYGPGGLITSNDNWQDAPNKQEIIDSTVAPTNDLESAIVATLPANGTGYTAIVRGVNDGTGIGVVEAYDLDRSVDSKLANISTRGLVQTGDDVLIAGTIVLGQASQKVIIRAIGPSLSIAGKLLDPTLQLVDSNGAQLAFNDNWRSDQEAEIIASTIPPTDDAEAAIVYTLTANGASYTAIVRGVNDTTGIAVVEVYALQ